MDWTLTDEESEKAVKDEWQVMFDEPMPSSVARNAVAKAQDAKTKRLMVEWGTQICKKKKHRNPPYLYKRFDCVQCMEQLRKEV